jgi:hypothetical protein
MPCTCWYEPREESKKLIKDCCVKIIDEIHALRKLGDPLGCELKDVKELLDHLYDPGKCNEKIIGKNE